MPEYHFHCKKMFLNCVIESDNIFDLTQVHHEYKPDVN
jgi:hypothetical protein